MGLKIRAGRTWLDWLDRLAAHCDATATCVIEQAVYRYADGVGFAEPHPRRLGGPARRPGLLRRVARERLRFVEGGEDLQDRGEGGEDLQDRRRLDRLGLHRPDDDGDGRPHNILGGD